MIYSPLYFVFIESILRVLVHTLVFQLDSSMQVLHRAAQPTPPIQQPIQGSL
mgnify:CR=1 FL=1